MMPRFLSSKAFKIIGYPIVFIIFFTLFFILGFPLDSFHDDFERELTSRLEREVRIGDMGISLTGGMVFTNVEIEVPTDDDSSGSFDVPEKKSKNGKEEEEKKAANTKLTYFLDEVVVNVGLLDLLFDHLSLDVDIEGLGGSMSLEYSGPIPGKKAPKKIVKPKGGRRSKAKENEKDSDKDEEDENPDDEDEESIPLNVRIEAAGISIKRLHDLRKLIPVPIAGTADLVVNLESETGLFKDADGKISLSLKDVLLSRKDFEIDIFEMKMAVPPLAIASLDLNVNLDKGTGEVSKFEIKSKHFDANVQGTVSLKDPVTNSQFDLYLTFKVLPAYMDQSDSVKTIVSSLDTFSRDMKRAHRDDDYYGFRYKGAPGKGRFTPQARYTPPGKKAQTAKSSRSQRDRNTRKNRTSRSVEKPKGPLTKPSASPPLHNERSREPRAGGVPQFPPSDQIPRPGEINSPRHTRPDRFPSREEVEEEESPDEEEEEEAPEEEEESPDEEEEGEEEGEEPSEEGEEQSEEESPDEEEEGEEEGEEPSEEGEEPSEEGEEPSEEEE